MSSVLVINASGRETRVALVDNGHIAEFYLERKKDKGIVGNIYKGKVTRVLPGMQAAFVDVGLDKAAFLYVGDVLFDPDVTRHQFDMTEGEHEDETPDVPEEPNQSVAGAVEEAVALDAVPTEAVQANADDPPEAPAEFEVHDLGEGSIPPPPPLPTAPQPGFEAHAAPPALEAPSGAEVVAAALAQVESGAIDAPKSQAPREVKFKERPEKHEKEKKKKEFKKGARIEELLKVGQEVLVQISKDPIGTKGARLTSHISIPGRHLVFMPTVDHVGISRRIGNEKERRRLREIVDRLRPPGTGFIVRTVAENVPQDKLEADIRFLLEVWNETVRKSEKNHRPGLMHPDLDLILRATRDLFAQDVEQLIIDDADEHRRVQNFVAAQDPALKDRVVLHESEEPIFDAFGIEEEIKRATARKVWLKSGGYLIIDQAEALTAIDVNSGRYVGKKNLEDTIVKINTEAAKEIVYQLRLRNIGGIIICDFIDMEKQQNRDKVFKSLQEALGRDKAKTNVLRISEMGLVEMTRKRVRESLGRTLHEDCAYCAGQGYVKTSTTVAYEIFRELRRSASGYKDPTLVVQCQTEVANVLQSEERDELRHLMDRYNKSIQVRARPDYHREQYDLFARPVSGIETKVAGSATAHQEGQVFNLARKPGSNEARFDRDVGGGGGGGGGGGRERDRRRNKGRGGGQHRQGGGSSSQRPPATDGPKE